MKASIGLDTSNYRTSVAVVSAEGQVFLDERSLLNVVKGERGLRQSDALFAHLKLLPHLTEAIRKLPRSCVIVSVCASDRPRDGEESYMPVFQAGITAAHCIANVLNVPIITTTHQRGHIAAASFGTGLDSASEFLALHLSGGTTDLLHVCGSSVKRIGGSLDLHAGQLIDRIGVRLGLPFPSGADLEKLALNGRSSAILPLSMSDNGLACHFSGAESCAMRKIEGGLITDADVAREVFDLLARVSARLIASGSEKTGLKKTLIMGGIASSLLFRELLCCRLKKNCPDVEAVFGRPEYSGDNAVGIARLGLANIQNL